MQLDLPNITQEWIDKIFTIPPTLFEEKALLIYQYQYRHNSLYAQYANAVGQNPDRVRKLTDIPFLPIGFFKSHRVTTGHFTATSIFESSGTTGSVNSKHYVKDLGVYQQSFNAGFQQFYGKSEDYCIIALLPSYLERQHSSLVVMADDLIKKSGHPSSGFYLYEYDRLYQLLAALEQKKQKTILLGVTFALLDFAEKYSLPLNHTIVMETGGMKGRREEWTRQQVHEFLKNRFQVKQIHSEYGMTELLSQAYSKGEGIFECPAWMKILVREDDDPLLVKNNGSGVINVIDLANIHSCSFIATDDAGKLYPDGNFEVLGRIDNSDIRGCSLMMV
jgi:phenylacetate-coenzyme A ligase PaaK-like adenylate-forming protein